MVKTSPSKAGDEGSISGQGTKITHVSQPKNQKVKQKQYCNKFNTDFTDKPSKKKILIKKKALGEKNGLLNIAD